LERRGGKEEKKEGLVDSLMLVKMKNVNRRRKRTAFKTLQFDRFGAVIMGFGLSRKKERRKKMIPMVHGKQFGNEKTGDWGKRIRSGRP